MFKRISNHTLPILAAVFLVVGCNSSSATDSTPGISGKIIQGYRVIQVDNETESLDFTVYRGDYIKFIVNDLPDNRIRIPELEVEEALTGDMETSPRIKMKKTGEFSFDLGHRKGTIRVVEYDNAHYSEIGPKEAKSIIENVKPFILDVRTPGEYNNGHLKNAYLLPVQSLQNRLDELSEYKNEDILIYCHSGNRSTVASKILIDAGFKRIYNLKGGIVKWSKAQYEIVK